MDRTVYFNLVTLLTCLIFSQPQNADKITDDDYLHIFVGYNAKVTQKKEYEESSFWIHSRPIFMVCERRIQGAITI